MQVLKQISAVVDKITRWTKIANVAAQTIEFFHQKMKENFPDDYGTK